MPLVKLISCKKWIGGLCKRTGERRNAGSLLSLQKYCNLLVQEGEWLRKMQVSVEPGHEGSRWWVVFDSRRPAGCSGPASASQGVGEPFPCPPLLSSGTALRSGVWPGDPAFAQRTFCPAALLGDSLLRNRDLFWERAGAGGCSTGEKARTIKLASGQGHFFLPFFLLSFSFPTPKHGNVVIAFWPSFQNHCSIDFERGEKKGNLKMKTSNELVPVGQECEHAVRSMH